jgi:hypothetical protein
MAKLRTEPERQAYERRMALLYEQLRRKGHPFEKEGASTQNCARKALVRVIRYSSNESRAAPEAGASGY